MSNFESRDANDVPPAFAGDFILLGELDFAGISGEDNGSSRLRLVGLAWVDCRSGLIVFVLGARSGDDGGSKKFKAEGFAWVDRLSGFIFGLAVFP